MEKEAQNPQLPQNAVMHSNLSLADEIELEIAKIFFLANQINFNKNIFKKFLYEKNYIFVSNNLNQLI